jgi:hypothetical protein
METMMCRIDEQDFPIDPRQLTPQEWESFKRRVTKCAQQARQQALRAAAMALLRALLAGVATAGSLLARIAGKAWSAYAMRRDMAGSGPRARRSDADGYWARFDRIRNLRQRSREPIALARISQHGCQTLFDRGEPQSGQ